MPKTPVETIDLILKDLLGRSGFDAWWYEIDDETLVELRAALIRIEEDARRD